MQGYLQSHDRAKERLKLGPDGHTVTPLTESESGHLRMMGSYSFIAGKRVCLYRWRDRLCLRVADENPIELDGVQVEWNSSDGKVHVVVRRGSEIILDERYQLSSEIERLSDDLTPFVEAEHFDIFLFIRNVLADPPRAQRLYADS